MKAMIKDSVENILIAIDKAVSIGEYEKAEAYGRTVKQLLEALNSYRAPRF